MLEPGGDVPTFQESGIRHNRFRLSCTNRESYEWLCATADSMVVRVDGGNDLPLKLVPTSEVPQLLRAEIYISGPLLVYLWYTQISYSCESQNKGLGGLHTDRWVLQSTSKGQLLIWGIDQESCAALEATCHLPTFLWSWPSDVSCVTTLDWSKGRFTVMCV